MSEDCHESFDIYRWRESFDAEIKQAKAHLKVYTAEVVNEIYGDGILTAEDAVMLWGFHVRADGDIARGN